MTDTRKQLLLENANPDIFKSKILLMERDETFVTFLSAKLVVMSLTGLQQNSSIDCINRYCLEIKEEKGCCIRHERTYNRACI